MHFRAVILDLDDTLHDKSANLLAFSRLQYVRANLDLSGVDFDQWQREYVAANNLRLEKPKVFSRLAETFMLKPALRQDLLDDFEANLGSHTRPFDGVVELLGACRARSIQLGIVTNGRDAFQRSKIRGMGITGMVDHIVTSGGLGIKKPDHRIFQECLRVLAVDAENAIFIGDDFGADMEPAIQLGMHTIWKSTLHSTRVDHVDNDFGGIREYLMTIL